MGHWQKIRIAARDLRAEVCDATGRDPAILETAASLVSAASGHLDLVLSPEAANSENLHGSLALIEDDVIHFNDELDEWFKQYCIAHEIGHHELHHKSIRCGSDEIENLETDEELPTATSLVIGYGPNERREREANLFALEFLLPAEQLRNAFLEGGLNAQEISKAVGMPRSMVERQLARALLTQEPDKESKDKQRVKVELNESQQKAVDAKDRPTLISAGPGTGKTETLIRRIISLLNKGIAPEKILALTFSHKATEEMRERISHDRPLEARRMQIMTFHSFGLEILRKFWEEAGLDKDSNLLDPIDAILMLEENLAELELDHYMMLSNPEFYLPAILNAVSRAKDELCGPARYRELAGNMLSAAKDDTEKLAAEKALEVARVYEFYQNRLDEEKLLDFGDLIFKAVNLLETNETARNYYLSRYDAVLVDEFQDVNRASGVLLRQISGEGKGLWAVGDLRQSIYRWRGASPQNIREFESEYEAAERLSLETNYRSRDQIVGLFGAFAKKMIAGDHFSDWEVYRKEAGGDTQVTITVADKYVAEAAEIGRQIKERKQSGVDFKDQAIICRTHNQLADLAAELEDMGIPVLYLGKLFEREEIRDLLALLELRTRSGPHALLRVARMNDYNLGDEDLEAILLELSGEELVFPSALKEAAPEDKISAAGLVAWEKLVSHLRLDEEAISAASFLNRYLFSDSTFLRGLIEDTTPSGKQKLIAIYQFLHLAKSLDQRFRKKGVEQIAYFLKHVRRLAWFGEQTNLAQIPPAAENFDAVRLITVHGAKGLEFDTVYIPNLATSRFPGNRRGTSCPEPVGLVDEKLDQHEEEEQCLFFVAMSRAKDKLNLSRSDYYGAGKSKESKFLTALEEELPAANIVQAPEPVPEPDGEPADNRQTFYMAEINRYDRCPKQFYYYHTKGLKGQDNVSPYVKFHRCLYHVIGELNSRKASGKGEVTSEAAREILDKRWSEANIDEHPYAPFYKKTAVEIAERIAERIDATPVQSVQPELELDVANGTVRIKPDAVEVTQDGREAVVTKYKTGKVPNKETVKLEDVAAKIAAERHFETAESSVRRYYLSESEQSPVSITARVSSNRIETIESHIDGINSRKFDPNPSDRNCPGCQYYFVCPGGE